MSDQLLGPVLPSAVVPQELANNSLVATHEIHRVHLPTEAVTRVDKQLLSCG
jgi:hypothetical protein